MDDVVVVALELIDGSCVLDESEVEDLDYCASLQNIYIYISYLC